MRIKNTHFDFLIQSRDLSLKEYIPNDSEITYSISHIKKEDLRVNLNDVIKKGTIIAENNAANIHSSVSGIVTELTSSYLKIISQKCESEDNECINFSKDITSNYPEYLKTIGLLGMGGSMFPSSLKFKAASNVHTLLINGAECEPGITIDASILLNHKDYIIKGAEASLKALNAKEIILCLKENHPDLNKIRSIYPYKIHYLQKYYPQGAEKLILKTLTKKLLPIGSFPFHLGYMVQNVCSVRAIGKAITEKSPVIDRPLTVHAPKKNVLQNIIVPIGVKISEVLSFAGCNIDKDDIVINGGLMMGNYTSVNDPITKGTISLFVMKKNEVVFNERECIRCGACIDACPLFIHPINIVECLKFQKNISESAKIQLKECFLCGMCSLNCPAYIPLAKYLKEGKKNNA